MSFEVNENLLIEARNLGKDYPLYDSARQRLSHLLLRRNSQTRQFHALKGVNLQLGRGGSLGLVGQNGAGKSTLLQLLCGTLQPSHGQLLQRGRIAPLLELGAGFNPEFTGRENIFMNAAVLGLGGAEIRARLQEIIDFADIGEFIDQPVRTYSSGMYVRLAFAIATRIDPDLLVIDEAIAVGDGQFARKSFDRILQLRESGVALLFCSHAMFQIEALCEQAAWLHRGEVREMGPASRVVAAYNAWLNAGGDRPDTAPAGPGFARSGVQGHARISGLQVACDGVVGSTLHGRTGHSALEVEIRYLSDPQLPAPTLAVALHGADGRVIASTGSWIDGVTLGRDADGGGRASLRYDPLLLLKGRYSVSVYLMCERGMHVYDAVEHAVTLDVEQDHLEQGLVSLPHQWQDLAS